METFTEAKADQLPLNQRVNLLAHNVDGLVALEKPPGAMSHPNKPEDIKKSLLKAEYDYDEECFTWTDSDERVLRAWLINRLDSPTSGVILLGLNPEISQTIKQNFRTHKVTKIYYALVKGMINKPKGIWFDKLSKDPINNGPRVKASRTISAKARYQIVKSPKGGFPLTLIKLFPLTGRTHQLRVQCKKHGLPIVGDRTYGSFSFNREVKTLTTEKRMMLHSAETVVNYTFKGKVREFRAVSELPDAFYSVLNYRPGINPARLKSSTSPNLEGRRFREV